MRRSLIGMSVVIVVVAAAIFAWVLNFHPVNHWLAVHTGAVNESGPYYGFWSGFGSDLAEFSILGAIGTAAYQLFKKYNCHEPRCPRVGTHPAAGGQFFLCYHHHPDYMGKRPTHELIQRLHEEDVARRQAIHDRLHDINSQLAAGTLFAWNDSTDGNASSTPSGSTS